MSKLAREVQELLERGIHPRWRKVETRLLTPLIAQFLDSYDAKAQTLRSALVQFLRAAIETEVEQIAALRDRHAEFNKRYAHATIDEERREHILEYARDLGADRRQLAGDRGAFARWFGADAVTERFVRRHAAAERKIVLWLRCLGELGASILVNAQDVATCETQWRRMDLEPLLKPLLAYDGDNRVRVAAFACLATLLLAMPSQLQERSVDEGTLRFIYRSALESRQDVWIQCEALRLLQSLSPASLRVVLEQRLSTPREGDDLFVRRRAVLILCANLQQMPDLHKLIAAVAADPSPYVRQALPGALRAAPTALLLEWLPRSARQDSSPQVRAAALREIVPTLNEEQAFRCHLALLGDVLLNEQDNFVLRVALRVVTDGHEILHGISESQAQQWQEQLQEPLARLHSQAADLRVRRWAAATAESLWCGADSLSRELRVELQTTLASLQPGNSVLVKQARLQRYGEERLGRVLAQIAQCDYGFDVTRTLRGVRIRKGDRKGLRLWRLLHEFRNPSPDKRQVFRHTVARLFEGEMQAPSGILSELAETKVPGEPLHFASEAGWRPYLPLVDQALSSLELPHGKSMDIYTSEGLTRVMPPHSLPARVRAYWRLSRHFAEFSRARNWQEGSQKHPVTYVRMLEQLGYRIHFSAYPQRHPAWNEDAAVQRYFPAALGLSWTDMGQQLQDYFFSGYENSLSELALFCGAGVALFVGRHIYLNARARRSREALPLVIGGWGTRGKSSTERIKAAMLNALGYGIVSKTTGCEAMFLYADAFGKMREMFLFRPYDKATIWEQLNVMRHAQGLNADVFLWECMALTPAYVQILQRHWSRDDLSTITNTFPDHEDLQGPAGINIAEVMTNFIPPGATLLTTEEQMRPVLDNAAQQLGTQMIGVDWLDAGLLTPDVLARFPYDEHPYNIALALRLGEELGIERDFALKEMADRVVPDLGVLKTYPAATLNGRTLEFVNGMSANERFACLDNWERMAFDRHDPQREPGVWISTVVNNRADRVARSRVFADIISNDISADQHFLIGSNLTGLVGYIHAAWQTRLRQLTLRPAVAQEQGTPVVILTRYTRRAKVATDAAQVAARLQAMLTGLQSTTDVAALMELGDTPDALRAGLCGAGLETHADAILAHHIRNREEYAAYRDLAENLASGSGDSKTLDKQFQTLLDGWFWSRIVVIDDLHATGNQIVQRICAATPPGYKNKIMGIQNIKGTGLDFLYRWQAWDTCYRAATQLRSMDSAVAKQGLRALSTFREYSPLCEDYVRETVEMVRHRPLAQRESFQAELLLISSNLDTSLREIQMRMGSGRRTGWVLKVLEAIEAFLDAGDAVKRRKYADKIYKDLISERISSERAALELQGLNKRQKGGWLQERLALLMEKTYG